VATRPRAFSSTVPPTGHSICHDRHPGNKTLSSSLLATVPVGKGGDSSNASNNLMGKVLLVEDELLVREVAAEDLGEAGFEVTTASDGDEALAILRDGASFDLLFTDIRMPGATDGWALAREARQLIPGLKVIYATGFGDAGDGLSEGECYVRKPYNLKDLQKAFETLGL